MRSPIPSMTSANPINQARNIGSFANIPTTKYKTPIIHTAKLAILDDFSALANKLAIPAIIKIIPVR